MSTAVAIFAKTIGLSPVKTRLSKSIGKSMAEEFYRYSVNAIEELLLKLKIQSNDMIVPYWALAEENGKLDKRWSNFKAIWTGEGDLGERIFHILDELLKRHDKVIIIGTDSPQFEGETILKAIDRLNENPQKCIIGPACDGGFYLFGSSSLISKEIWTSVTYSREDTLKQLLINLKNADIQYSFLEKMADVDELKDLKVIYKSLCSIKNNLSKSQEELIEWLELIDSKNIIDMDL